MTLFNPDLVTQQVFQVLETAVDREYIGEPVSQLEHALQCAEIARASGGSQALVIAALLHDIGHLCAPEDAQKMDQFGIDGHHRLAANWVRELGFGETVACLIEGHVSAKRYLVAKNTHYIEQLSHASQETLKRQGGPMDSDEMRTFEAHPMMKEMLRLRAFDDRAKQLDWQGPSLHSYRGLLNSYLQELRS